MSGLMTSLLTIIPVHASMHSSVCWHPLFCSHVSSYPFCLRLLHSENFFQSVVAGYFTMVRWEEVRWCCLWKNVLDPPFHFLCLSGHACSGMLTQQSCQPLSGFLSSRKFRCVKYFLSTRYVKGMALVFRVDPCDSCLKKAKVCVCVWTFGAHWYIPDQVCSCSLTLGDAIDVSLLPEGICPCPYGFKFYHPFVPFSASISAANWDKMNV